MKAALSNKENTIAKILEQLPFYRQLGSIHKEALLANAALCTYEKGALIHDNHHECLGMVILLRGETATSMISDEGREILLYCMHPGDVDVLTASCVIHQITFETLMTAEKDCELLVLPAALISRLQKQNIYVQSYCYEIATKRFSDVIHTMQTLLFKRIDQRIASWLLKQKTAEVRVTQEALARNINSTREVVTRMLGTLQSNGWIHLSRGKIVITNPDALAALLDD